MPINAMRSARRSGSLARRRSFDGVVIALCMLLGASSLRSQVTVGTPGVGGCLPFSCTDGGRFQQIYAASAFPGPMTVTGLTFFFAPEFSPGALAPGMFTISLAISNMPIGGLSANLDDNVSFDEQLFISAALPPIALHATSFTIFGNPFFYNPALGNLLMDVTSSTDYVGLDILISDAAQTETESAECSGPQGVRGCGAGFIATDVTRFEGPIVSTPEPATVWLVGTGLIGLMLTSAQARRRVSAIATTVFQPRRSAHARSAGLS